MIVNFNKWRNDTNATIVTININADNNNAGTNTTADNSQKTT